MASKILYPPVIDAKMPTFVIEPERGNTKARVYFSISDFNNLNNFCRIKASKYISYTKDTQITDEILSTKGLKAAQTKLFEKHKNDEKWRAWRVGLDSSTWDSYLELGSKGRAVITDSLYNVMSAKDLDQMPFNFLVSQDMLNDKGNLVIKGKTYTDVCYPDIYYMQQFYQALLGGDISNPYSNINEPKYYLGYQQDEEANIDGYVYPWIMVSCVDQKSGKSLFRQYNDITDSGIHFYTLHRDKVKYENDESNCYYIEINNYDINGGFKDNIFYQIQIRFLDYKFYDHLQGVANNDASNNETWTKCFPSASKSWVNAHLEYFSEWSTVCILKAITRPAVTLEESFLDYDYPNNTRIPIIGLSKKTRFLNISGKIAFVDDGVSLEYLTKIRYELYNLPYSGNNYALKLVEDSGWIDVDINNSKSSVKFEYDFKKTYNKKANYILVISYTTNNGFVDSSYQFKPESYDNAIVKAYANLKTNVVDTKQTITLNVVSNDEDGQVMLKIAALESNFKGKIRIFRTDSSSDFKLWDKIFEMQSLNDKANVIYWIDRTTSADKWYRYAVSYMHTFTATYKDINGKKVTTTRTQEEDVINTKNNINTFLDDAFLIGNYCQLKVKFDPTINSFKWKVTENSVETFGSKYPFFNRNAIINYRSFPLSGTIASWMDDEENFIMRDDLFDNVAVKLHMQKTQQYGIDAHYDWVLEKKFRDAVAAFLMDPRPKLFKTLTEGNILVRISDVSFTPNKVLGRLIWSFSCTATEIDDATAQNLDKYDIQNNKVNLKSKSVKLKPLNFYENNEDLLVLTNGFFIMQDKDLKDYTIAAIGVDKMNENNIRIGLYENSEPETEPIDEEDVKT